MTILFNNIDANATSLEFTFNGGSRVLNIRGDDFGGGTVVLQMASSSDPSNPNRFVDIENASFTANGSVIVENTKIGLIYRAVFSGATNPDNVFTDMV